MSKNHNILRIDSKPVRRVRPGERLLVQTGGGLEMFRLAEYMTVVRREGAQVVMRDNYGRERPYPLEALTRERVIRKAQPRNT